MPPGVLRLALVIEFLLAALVIDTLWSQVGGQGHLDLMPWYFKLSAILGLAYTIVRATAESISRQDVWNRVTLFWLAAVLLLLVCMGGVTYYYHLHEDEDAQEEGGDVALFLLPRRGHNT